jgi:hypothetical protein
MALPANVTQTIVTGNYVWLDGLPAAGTVTFLPYVEYVLVAPANTVVYVYEVTVPLDAAGHFSVPLIATDDPDINPTGWTYTVRVLLHDPSALPGQSKPVESIFSIYVPVGPPINIAERTPVQSSPGNAVIVGPAGDPGAVVSVNGQTDVVVLDAGDVGAEPAGAASTVNSALNAHVSRAAGAHAASAVSFAPGQGVSATTVQGAITEDASHLAAHLASQGVVHNASAVAFAPVGTIAASTVQTAIAEDSAELAAHLSDTSAAHAATAVSFTPAGSIAATTVQAAIVEAASEASGAVTAHANKTTDAHHASAVSVVPTGSIASTDAQNALVEVAADAASATATVNNALTAHLNDTIDAHHATAVSFAPAAGIAAITVQAAIVEDAGDLAVHIGKATAAHPAAAVSFAPQGGIASATVQAAIVEDAGHLATHIAAGAHPASSVTFVPTGSVAATNVQNAVAEVASEAVAATGSVATGLANHLADAVDAHDASAISFVPTGTVSSTTVQAAVAEVSGDASTASTYIISHMSDPTDAHDASAISIVDALGLLNADTVEDAIAEIVGALNAHGMWGSGSWAGGGGGGSSSVATTTAVASSSNPAVSGTSVTITATVTSGGSPVTTGTVTFKEGSTTLQAAATVNSQGKATYTTTALSVATHTITAAYSGATGFNASTGSVGQLITSAGGGNAATVTAVSSSQNPAVVGSSASITATVTSGGSPVTLGTVTFSEGATTLAANVALDGTGNAVFSAVALTVATHLITATYNAGTGYSTSSGQVNQVITASSGGGTAPGAPTSVTAAAAPIGVSLNWSLPTGDNVIGGDPKEIASYNIEQSTSPTTGFKLVSTVAAQSTKPKLIYPLVAGTTYYFRIRASYMVNPTGYSIPSTTVSATPTAGPAVPATWAAAVATNDLNAITLWYDANTGYDSEGVTFADLWGPGQTAAVTINDAWLTTNAAAGKVVNDGGGHWTVSKLHAASIQVARSNVTVSHCYADRPFAANMSGFDVFNDTTTTSSVTGLPVPSTTFRGIIFDHCTANGNYGDGTHDAYGDGTNYYNNTDRSADGLIVRNCDIYAYRAGWLQYGGCTSQYNWVHDLYIWSDSHNTANSFHAGPNNNVFRNLLTDGTSSAISLYADEPNFTGLTIQENVLTTWGNALQEINFPNRPPNYWNLLYDQAAIGSGHVEGAPLPAAYGYKRELLGNMLKDGTSGDNQYFTKISGNRLISGRNLFFDNGESPVAHTPMLHQARWYDFGNAVPNLQTYDFTPTPNSTLLVLLAPQAAAHTTTPTPTITAKGQYVAGQTFTKIAETGVSDGGNYALRLMLYKAPVGAQTSFQHLIVDYMGNSSVNFYGTIFVFEVTQGASLTLVKYAPSVAYNPAFNGVVTSITSGNLSSAAANGNLVMAFCAGTSPTTTDNVLGNQAGWTKMGVISHIYSTGSPGVVGASYWRKDFTGTNMSLTNLGTGISPAGLLLCEFSGA